MSINSAKVRSFLASSRAWRVGADGGWGADDDDADAEDTAGWEAFGFGCEPEEVDMVQPSNFNRSLNMQRYLT